MADTFPPALQHPRLILLAEKLGISRVHLRRDACGDWMLEGRFGHVYAVYGSYQIMIMGWSTQGWNICKREFAPFATLTQDGDDEGGFTLERDPMPDEAIIIRKRVGLKKRQTYDDATMAAMRERGKALSASRAKDAA